MRIPPMRIPDAQLDLFSKRLEAIGVGRRDFLKVVGAMAAFGGLGFATEARAAKASRPGPGENSHFLILDLKTGNDKLAEKSGFRVNPQFKDDLKARAKAERGR